jgi:hypothetical protein
VKSPPSPRLLAAAAPDDGYVRAGASSLPVACARHARAANELRRQPAGGCAFRANT